MWSPSQLGHGLCCSRSAGPGPGGMDWVVVRWRVLGDESKEE